ncbi:hypothetical protein A3Q56_05397 [Intoshia linei]|uniref:Uncharacterized protein n=1 Tax=Intoshia linei TaxID=1819745 RepID=A0A177AXX6_9BILA|nr:hypothetical protein A3Q56_05397 [Intoshia linei]
MTSQSVMSELIQHKMDKYDNSEERIKIPCTDLAKYNYQGYPLHSMLNSRKPILAKSPTQSLKDETPYFPFKGKLRVEQYRNDKGPNLGFGTRYNQDIQLKRVAFRDKNTSEKIKNVIDKQLESEKMLKEFKTEKLKKMQEIEETKRKDLEMLKDYNPWGKPGGGAPSEKNNFKKKKFMELDLINNSAYLIDQNLSDPEYGTFQDNFNKPGNGAPLRSESGKLISEIKSNNDIKYGNATHSNNKQINFINTKLDMDKRNAYYNDLNAQIYRRSLRQQNKKIDDLKKEIEVLQSNPFGGIQTIKNETCQNNEPYEYDYDPWGKGYGNKVVDKCGNPVRRTNSLDFTRHAALNVPLSIQDGIEVCKNNKIEKQMAKPINRIGKVLNDNINKVSGGSGEPIRSENGQVISRIGCTLDKSKDGKYQCIDEKINEKINIFPENESFDKDKHLCYFPWGTPGSGAPIKDENGKINPKFKGNLNFYDTDEDKIKKMKQLQVRSECVANEIENARRQRIYDDKFHKQGNGDLVHMMHDSKIGKPKYDDATGFLLDQHKSSCDVTRQAINYVPIKNNKSREYFNILEKEAHNRENRIKLEKMQDQALDEKHLKYVNDVWGRPGGGAQNLSIKKKNFDNIINSPYKQFNTDYWKDCKNLDEYKEKKIDIDTELRKQHLKMIRSTVDSTSKNFFEYKNDDEPILHNTKPDFLKKIPYAICKNYVSISK